MFYDKKRDASDIHTGSRRSTQEGGAEAAPQVGPGPSWGAVYSESSPPLTEVQQAQPWGLPQSGDHCGYRRLTRQRSDFAILTQSLKNAQNLY